jgi:hypothetical protein
LPVVFDVVPSLHAAPVPAVFAFGIAGGAFGDVPVVLRPPWCAQAPLPVVFEVVPSLQTLPGPFWAESLAGSARKKAASAANPINRQNMRHLLN